MLDIVVFLNKYLWNFLIILLIGAGLFFTFASKFVQFRFFGRSMKEMWAGRRRGERASQGITPFQAFVTGVASRVGVGNIAGVAIAISIGGPGAVFWMWMVALIGMSSAVVESSLGQLYKVKDEKTGLFRGGPAYYITMGMKNKSVAKVWAILFALLLVSTYGFIFNAVQANTLVQANNKIFDFSGIDNALSFLGLGIIPVSIQGIVLVIITGLFVFGGIRRVASFCEKLVPVMAILYILMALWIIVTNLGAVPHVFKLIFVEAFNFKSATGGIFGVISAQVIMQGIKRGLFSNEAGMGSAPNAAASSDVDHPMNQGLIQMFGVFVDTILICSATAFILLVGGDYTASGLNGVQLTQHAITSQVGAWGEYFLALVIFLFAWSSILGNYAYSESNIRFMTKSDKKLFAYRCFVLVMVYFGSVAKVPVVWELADLFMGSMAVINLVAILVLWKKAEVLIKDYGNQLKANKEPHFNIDEHPSLSKDIRTGIWNG